MEKNISNPEIEVILTGPEHHHCICIKLGTYNVYLHTRSAIDLQKKLSDAILDWTTKSAIAIIQKME